MERTEQTKTRPETIDELMVKMKAADEILETIRFDVTSEAREKIIEMRTKWHRQVLDLFNDEMDELRKQNAKN